MPHVTTVKAARKDQGTCGRCGDPIPVGAPYVHWSFRFGGKYKRCAKPSCAPRASELTQNETRSAAYALTEEEIAFDNYDDFEEAVQDYAQRILDEVLETIQEKMDNIESGFGHTDLDAYYNLEEQYGEVEQWAENVERVTDQQDWLDGDGEFMAEEAREALIEALGECPL